MRFCEDSITNAFCFNIPTIDLFDDVFDQIDKEYFYTFYTLYVRKRAFSFKILKPINKNAVINEFKCIINLINYCLENNEDKIDTFRFTNKAVYFVNMIAFVDLYIESIKFRNDTLTKEQVRTIYKKLFWNKTDYILKLCETDKYAKFKYELLQIIPREQLLTPSFKAQIRNYLRKEVNSKYINNNHAKRFIEYYYDKPYADALPYLSRDIGMVVENNNISYGNNAINKLNGYSPYKKESKNKKEEPPTNVEYINDKFRN
jgi:hypothetical protein